MNTGVKERGIDPRILLQAILIWLAAALILLLISSAIVAAAGVKAAHFAYFSSGISFLAAFCAGFVVSMRRQDFNWLWALLCGLTLTVFLLMLGFLAVGEELSSDGVLSVAAFTLSGALIGCFFAPKRGGKSRGRARPKRKKTS